MRIADVLHHKGRLVHKARTTDAVAAAVQKLSDNNIGALLVYDRWGKYAGIFSERHLMHGIERFGAAALELPVGELMVPDRITCHPGDLVGKVMGLMTVHRIRHMPVEEAGKIVGIVSIGDLVRAVIEEKELEVEVLRDMARAH
ncbi:MAG TPA: CBS domain-containing protein [Stellaceae bacterium]|nr:CBS domain-containing protein [Stellaceae bacterium]